MLNDLNPAIRKDHALEDAYFHELNQRLIRQIRRSQKPQDGRGPCKGYISPVARVPQGPIRKIR